MVMTQQRPRSQELLERMNGGRLYREAYTEGKTLSAWLEEQDPSEEYKDGLDAFQRLLKCAGIRVRSDLQRGIYASKLEDFDEDDNKRALLPEWASRIARQVAYGGWSPASRPRNGGNRAVYLSDDFALNTLARPYADAADVRAKQVMPAIPLDALVAITTPIEGDAYRAFYLTEPTGNQARWGRVAQAAELPRTKLTGGEHTVRLYKYGRALEVSYEQLRRRRIDLVAFHIARMAVQAETDKVATAIDILVNGDGNSGTAATNYNLTTLDAAATAGTLTLKAWIAFKAKFLNPYMVDVALTQEGPYIQLSLLTASTYNIPMGAFQSGLPFGGLRPINNQMPEQTSVGLTADAPSNKILGLDSRFALEHVVEIGSDINEVDRWVTRQVQVVTMSEVAGFDVFDANAVKTLRIDA